MDRTLRARNEFPGFIRGEDQERSQQLAKAGYQTVQSCLCGAAPPGIRRVRVKPILDGVMVNCRELDGDKLGKPLIDGMEFMVIIGRNDFMLQFGEFPEHPAIKLGQAIEEDAMPGGIKIVKIRELVAQSIA